MLWLGQLGVVVLTAAAAGAAVAPNRLGAGPMTGSRSEIPRRLALVSTLGGGLAVAVLAVAFVRNDWRLAYTVGHARPDIAWPFRLAGVWAGPEGSLLLWAAMMAGATAVVGRVTVSNWSTRLLAATTAAYGLVLLTVALPFERLAAPPGSGNGLQPVLEHPAMVWHPPVLYLGLVGLLVPAALILGAGAGRRSHPPPAAGPLLHLALAALTAGLATGSAWAYVELGWGGYWAWDPIENAGLVAWLVAASLVHRLGPAPRSAAPSNVMVALAAAVAVAVIWATTITRTGVLSSVHAFADRPVLRVVLVTIAVAFTGAALSMVAMNVAPGRHPGDERSGTGSTIDRIGSKTATLALLVAAGVVAVGTYEPALEMLVRANPFALSGRFYAVLLWPVATAAAVARTWASLRADGSRVRLAAVVVTAVAAMVVVGPSVGPFGLGLAAAGGAVCATAGGDAVRRRDRRWVVHLGMGLLLVGVAGTTASTSTTVVALVDQQAATPAGLITHRGVALADGPGITEAVATVELVATGAAETEVETFRPRLVTYVRSGASSTEIDTRRGWLTDTQVVLIDADADQATYRVNRQQRMSLVWLGAAVITLGLVASSRSRSPDGESRSTSWYTRSTNGTTTPQTGGCSRLTSLTMTRQGGPSGRSGPRQRPG
ncbi:MAG: cytochrome c biogenesis protein CcsA [Acidimicrobiia bacterium]|nr:cytochrome c biogenesis protein CcsA [Acidimicrobiia bacterium]